jgi:hypothetical protein
MRRWRRIKPAPWPSLNHELVHGDVGPLDTKTGGVEMRSAEYECIAELVNAFHCSEPDHLEKKPNQPTAGDVIN